jgi:hypothetical protein
LREAANNRYDQTKNFCFACGIEAETFDRAFQTEGGGSGGFSRHYHDDHNMWNYAYFVIMLQEQDKDDDDGLEL